MLWMKKKKQNMEMQASPKERLVEQFEQLQSGEEITFVLSETFGGWLATVFCNPEHPDKGKRFFLYTDARIDGQPAGKRRLLWSSNKSKDLAEWVLNRNGEPFVP
jgi:hypothetical protein